MAKPTTKVIDKGYKHIQEQLKLAKGSYTTIGVHSDAGQYEDGQAIGAIAFWNEYGTSRIPERPFLRSAIDANLDNLHAKQRELLSDIYRGQTTEKSLEILGFMIKTMIEERIHTSRSWAEPNSPSTTAAKLAGGAARGPTPLINSTLLSRSIAYKVKLKGGR